MIKIEFNDAEVQAALGNLSDALTDMSPVMNRIGMFLVASTEKRFDDTEAPDGSQWAPRSPVTLAIYAREKPPPTFGPVLHKSGTLRQSINHSYGPDEVTVGTNVFYAQVQQLGAVKGSLGAYWFTSEKGKQVDGSSPWGNIPARPFIGVSDSDRVGILDIIAESLARAVSGEA